MRSWMKKKNKFLTFRDDIAKDRGQPLIRFNFCYTPQCMELGQHKFPVHLSADKDGYIPSSDFV